MSVRFKRSNVYIAAFIVLLCLLLIMRSYTRKPCGMLCWRTEAEPIYTVRTAKGVVPWREVNENLFNGMGYTIQEETTPFPTLRHIKKPVCEEVFSDWLEVANSNVAKTVAPRTLPVGMINTYTMNGYAIYGMSYYNDLSTSVPQVWNQVKAWMTADPISFVTYPTSGGMSMYYALQYHRRELEEKSGFVIGSLRPWVEVSALRAGAANVLTVEYQNTTILGTDKMKYIHPVEFAKNFQSFGEFDFAASFSSMEHSGLQRYGDPADPIGDIREVLKIRCMLRQNGLLFLGLPRSQDEIQYNELRIYGRIRLALMFTGFELLNVFRSNASPANLSISDFDDKRWNHYTQETFVLRKM